ncbi:MAG: cupin domain-containing protein [Coriobacteriia bacterium]|nr:cupin domain-containing protein [Coriobacteriia bacterium]
MVIQDRLGEQVEMSDMHDGRGKTLVYSFFEGKISQSMKFFDIVVKPGTYVGYHRHQGNDEILYIVSGKAENFQDGNRYVLGAGDAILVKSGQAHAVRNTGDEDLEVLGFVAAPGGDIAAFQNLPLPDAIADWE